MNWLDNYIADNETGYYINYDGGLWVVADDEHLIHAAFGDDCSDLGSLTEITRDEFIENLIR